MEKKAQDIVRNLLAVHEQSITKRNSNVNNAASTSGGGKDASPIPPAVAATQDMVRELENLNKLLSGTWKSEDELFNLKEALIACDLPAILMDIYFEIAAETPKSYICIFLMDLLASPELPSSSTTMAPRYSTMGISIQSKVTYYDTPDLIESLETLVMDSTPSDAAPSPSAFASNDGAAAVAKYSCRLLAHLLSAEANAIDFVSHTKFMKFAARQIAFHGQRFVDVMQMLSLLSTFARCRPRLKELNCVEALIPLARDKGNLRAVVILCNLVGNDPQASPSLREIPNFFGHLVSVLKLALDSSTISSTSLATWSLVDASLPCWLCSQLPENRAEMAKLDILTLLRKVVDQAMATDDPEACQLAIGTFLQFAFFFKRSEAAALQMRLDELNTKTGIKPAPITRSGSWVAMNRSSRTNLLTQSRSMSFRRKAEAGRWNKCVAIIDRMLDELDAFAESGVDVEGSDEEAILDAMAKEHANSSANPAPLPSTSPLNGVSTNGPPAAATTTSVFSNRRALLRMNNALTTGLLPVPIERSSFVKLIPLVSPVGEMQVDLEYEVQRFNTKREEEEERSGGATSGGAFALGKRVGEKATKNAATTTLGPDSRLKDRVPRRSELSVATSQSSNGSALTPRRSNLNAGVALLPTQEDVSKWLAAIGLKNLAMHFHRYEIRGATMKEMFEACGVRKESLEKQKEKKRLIVAASSNGNNNHNTSAMTMALNPNFLVSSSSASPSASPTNGNNANLNLNVSPSNLAPNRGASSASAPPTPNSAKSTHSAASENSSLRKSLKNVPKMLLRSFSSSNKDGATTSGVLLNANGATEASGEQQLKSTDLEDDAEVDNVMKVFKIEDAQEAARLLHSLKVLYGFA